jgi:RNA polymerase sigma factor (sigma-70 family)
MLVHLRRLVEPSAPELGSDADLLAHFIRTRDQTAFAALVARHGPMVYRLCRRVLGDAHAAEDAVQAAFIVLARKAAHLRHPEALAAWLHGTAYRLALKMRAAEQRRRQIETRNRSVPSSTPADPLAELSARELLTVLDAELRRLPERYRLPVILCCLEGRTQPEAARLLGWTPGSVKGRLERGRVELHRRLLRRRLTLSAALLALEAAQATAARMPGTLAAAVVKAAVDAPSGAPPLTEMIAGLAGTKAKIVFLLALLLGAAAAGMSWLPQPNPEAKQAESSKPVQQHKEQARTDRYGDPLPPGALARLGTVRWRLPLFGIDRMVASPDGKTLVTVNPLRGVSVWEIATGRILRSIPSDLSSRPEWLSGSRQVTTSHPGAAQRATALSADGRTAVLASADGILYVVDIAAGKVRQRFQGHQGPIQEAVLSADGKVLASHSADGTLRIWDTLTGKQLRRLPLAEQEWVQCQPTHLALSSDGKTLAWIGIDKERTIHIYDVSAGKEKDPLLQHPGEERCITFSPKGDLLLATCNKGPAQLWDVRTGLLVRTLSHKGNFHPPEGVFSPDGAILALSIQEEALRLHEVATGKELWRTPSKWSSTEQDVLAFAPDGKTLFAKLADDPGSLLRRYNVRTGERILAPEESRGAINAIVFAPDDRNLHTSGGDKLLRTWKATTGEVLRQTPTESLSFGECFAPDGGALAVIDPNWMVRFYQSATGKELWRQGKPPGRRPLTIAFSPDGASLAVSEWGDDAKNGHRIVFRSTANGEEQRRIDGLDQPAQKRRDWAPGRDWRYDRTRLGTGTIAWILFGGSVYSCPVFNPDGRSLVWQTLEPGDLIDFREVSTGRKLREPLRWAWNVVAPLAFSPDGRTVAVPVERRMGWLAIDFQECAGWQKRLELPGLSGLPCPVAFSPDGLLFVMGDLDGAVRIYDSHSGRLLRRQEGHRAAVNRFVFSHDGQKLVTVSHDTTALVWDIADLLRLARGREIEIPPAELRSLWEDLAAADAVKGYRAIGKLSRSRKQIIPWLREHLRPVPAADPQRIARLMAQLDDDRFEVREKATKELAGLGESAVPDLRKALAGQPALELRRRAEALLKRTEELSPERLRTLRSVEVIESIGGAEAEALLKEWSQGAAGACLTREAKAALLRLAKRRTPKP